MHSFLERSRRDEIWETLWYKQIVNCDWLLDNNCSIIPRLKLQIEKVITLRRMGNRITDSWFKSFQKSFRTVFRLSLSSRAFDNGEIIMKFWLWSIFNLKATMEATMKRVSSYWSILKIIRQYTHQDRAVRFYLITEKCWERSVCWTVSCTAHSTLILEISGALFPWDQYVRIVQYLSLNN